MLFEDSQKSKKFVVVVCVFLVFVYLLARVFGRSLVEVFSSVKQNSYQHAAKCDEVPTKEEKKIFVEVSGAVRNPGVFEVKEGNLVNDILIMANGFTKNADVLWVSRSVNKAERVFDSMKLYVPSIGEGLITESLYGMSLGGVNVSAAGAEDKPKSMKINVNTSSENQLDLLPGVGPAYADKIVRNRVYRSYEDFKEKSGIPYKLSESLKEVIEF